jgi:hypothetical protein
VIIGDIGGLMMHTQKHHRTLSSLCLLGAVALWESSDALGAEHLLTLAGTINNGNCVDASGDYFFEAWGYDSSSAKVCEVFEVAGAAVPLAALGTCDPSVTQHRAALTVRNTSTFSFVSLLQETPVLTAWSSASPIISYDIPSSSTCSGGAHTDTQSVGHDTST